MAATKFRILPLVLLGSFLCFLLLPSETLGRVGGTVSRNDGVLDDEANDGNTSHNKRHLGGGYGGHKPTRYNNNHPGKHHGHYETRNVYFRPITKPKHHGSYYYIKRPVEDPRKPKPQPTAIHKPSHQPTATPHHNHDHEYGHDHEPEPNQPSFGLSFIPISDRDKEEEQSGFPVASPVEAETPTPTQSPSESKALTPEPTAVVPSPTPDLTTGSVGDSSIPIPDGESDQQQNEQSTNIDVGEPSEIQRRIAALALGGGAEFEDPSSYQSAALRRVEQQDGANAMSDAKLMQYFSLYCIFASTNSKSNDFIRQSRAFDGEEIPGWTSNSGWLETNSDPCVGDGWWGITCFDDKVINLDLFDNGLTGNFPPEVVYLAGDGPHSTGAGELVALDVFNNRLMSNNGDNSWMGDLGSQLGYLYIQNTVFSGQLPTKFPEGLVELDIANSMITGGLDGAAFEGLDSLRFLLMDGIQVNGTIPAEIARLPNLEYFFATDSMITGDLSYMESMSVIFEHWVDRNPGLGGTIPSFLGDLTTLQSFSIAECSFTGTIPETIGNLELMQQMWLYGNQLSGEIPASVGDLKFMRIFEVEGNNLSDSMPQSVCDNFQQGMLQVLGADCDRINCPCCTCCSIDECRKPTV